MMKHLRLIPLLILGLAAPALADSNGSATGGNAAGQSSLSGGLCQTSPTALSDGQQAGLEIDCTTHALKTSATITPSGQQAVSDTAGADSAGTFTNATQTTSVTATLETGTNAYSTVTVTVNGTYGTASATFEKSDDDALTNWYPVQCSQEGQPVIETGYSSLTNTARMWQCNTQGANAFRVRSTAVASGTVAVLISPSGMPTTNGATVAIGASGNITVVQPTGTNLHAVLDTTSTTAVTQATGTNLHAVLDTTSTTAVTQATASNLNAAVVGNAASGASDSGNPVKVGTIYNSSTPTVTNAQRVDLQSDSHGSLKGLQVDSTGAAIDYTQNLSFNPYPGGAVPVSCATGNVAAATATCTMPATTGKSTYVTGFDITGSGATLGSAITCTLTNTNSGTMSFTFIVTAGVLLADTSLIKSFAPALKATASNTAPVLSCPSFGTGSTNATINAAGYEL